MLWLIGVTLVLLWVLGMVSSYTMGGFLHLLLLAGIALLVLRGSGGRSG